MAVFPRHIRVVLPAAVLVGALIRVRALATGFVLDDFVHMAMGRGIFSVSRAPWDLFSFIRTEAEIQAGIAAGSLPWWTDPDLRLAFFRPLSSLLTFFDARVLGPNAALQHLHSLVWLALLIGAAALLFTRLLGPRAGAIAALIFACEEALTTPLAWVANRSALVASTFAVMALVAWTSRHTSRRSAIACEIFTVLAILSGEYGLGVLFLRGGLVLAERGVPFASRALRVLGLTAALAAYTLAHRAAGYGVASFPLYRDPTGDVAGYAAWAGEQLRRLVQDLALGVPTPVPPLWITSLLAIALLAALSFVALGVATRVSGETDTPGADAPDGRAAFGLAAGGLCALLPLASSIAHTRLLILPAIGTSALVAVVLDRARLSLRAGATENLSGGKRVALALLAGVAALIHLPHAAVRSWAEPGAAKTLNENRVAAMLRAPVPADSRVILLSAGDPTTILYFPQVRALYGKGVPRDFHVLTASPSAQRVVRVDARTLDIEMPRTGLLATPLAAVMRRRDKGLPEGQTVSAGSLRATILSRGALGPDRVRFEFNRSLDEPDVVVLTSRPGGFEPFSLPAVGASAGIPPAADPVESAP